MSLISSLRWLALAIELSKLCMVESSEMSGNSASSHSPALSLIRSVLNHSSSVSLLGHSALNHSSSMLETGHSASNHSSSIYLLGHSASNHSSSVLETGHSASNHSSASETFPLLTLLNVSRYVRKKRAKLRRRLMIAWTLSPILRLMPQRDANEINTIGKLTLQRA